MNQSDQNINKDMIDPELIDVESMDFSDDQTWLCTVPGDSGKKLDLYDWILCDWPNKDEEYLRIDNQLNMLLDNILKNEIVSQLDRNKFDSRTYVKPKKRDQRPSIQSIVEVSSNPPSISPGPSYNPLHPAPHPLLNPALHPSLNTPGNKYLTYNKYNNPLGPISPMLRLKTFNVDVSTDNSAVVKEYAMKRRSMIQDEDPQLEDMDASELSGRLSTEHTPSKPINIDLSQPAHNLHNTFNKGLTNMMNERGSLNMYQSGESLMRMSPPSLVSSLLMESSGNFNPESLEGKRSMPAHRDSGLPMSGRDSIDPMMNSMTLSILDEKDMNTSFIFISQTTNRDNDSLIGSLPPSLVSSVNSSFVVNHSRPKEDSNIFSSATFTHLEQSEKLLSARPRCQLYSSFKRDSGIKNSESYTKSKEEACQIDPSKVLNVNAKETQKKADMAETITLHFANNKFRSDAEKENFERDDAFYKEMGVEKPDEERSSLNVTRGKQELNEIIQARQKLSLARKGLPCEPDKPIQITDPSLHKTFTMPIPNMENALELLSKRRTNGYEKAEDAIRDTPKRNATFNKLSPKASAMATTVVYMKDEPQANEIIDINSATMTLIDGADRTLQQAEWGSQERAMVGSSESTDTGTFSSSSPPDSVPDTATALNPHPQVSSTPLAYRNSAANELLNIHATISPIYDMIDGKSYTLAKAPSTKSSMERTHDMHNTTVVNSATMVKKNTAKRDILAGRSVPETRLSPSQMKSTSRVPPTITVSNASMAPPVALLPVSHASMAPPVALLPVSHASMAPPVALLRKSSLPTSKLRQYSSHRELSRIPAGPPTTLRGAPTGRAMLRRNVYASNPALSPTAAAPLDHYVVRAEAQKVEEKPPRPVLTNPPALIRQGTETLRRERPQSQLVAPKDLRASGVPMPSSMRAPHLPPPTTRPYSIAAASQLQGRVSRPASGPPQKPTQVPVMDQPRPSSSNEPRQSGLPRPSRLPAPRRGLRPPSVYSVAPTGDAENY